MKTHSINRTKYLQSLSLCLIWVLICTACFGQNVVGVDMRQQVFPVIGDGLDTKLAVGMTIGLYVDGTTFSTVRETVSELSKSQRYQIPEYVLMKEHDLAAQGDKQGILALYATEDDRNFAGNRSQKIS